MIFFLFASFILAKTEICICDEECSSLCPPLAFIAKSNEAFGSFIKSSIQTEREVELCFYSKTKDHTFDIDVSPFTDRNVQLKALSNSKTIKVTLKDKETAIKELQINPNHQITLSQLGIAQNNHMSKLNIKNTPDQTIITNPDGLINVTCDQLQYSSNWEKCFIGSADHGSYTFTPGSKVFLKFNGTKVHVFAHMEFKSNYAKIFIDSKEVDRVSFYSNPSKFGVVYSSEELPFGEHLIEVQHDGNSDNSLTISSFVYDPLPKHDGQKFGFDKMTQKTEGQWSQNNENPLIFFTNEFDAAGTFKFLGTRFWLTGVRDGNHGKFSLKIDDKTIEVDQRIKTQYVANSLSGHYPALLYQSDVMNFEEHTVTVTRTDSEVSLVNFLYTRQPYNGVYVKYNELKKTGLWREENDGYNSRETGSSLSIFGYFNHFWIIGNNDISQAYMNVYYNDELKGSIDTSQIRSSISDKVLLFESKNSVLDTYQFKIENNGDNQLSSSAKYLHISNLYYVNDQTIIIDEEHETIKIDSMQKEGIWSEDTKSDNVKNLYTNEKDAKVTVKFSGDKFWIVGSLGPNYGNVDIILDDVKISTVSLYREREEDNVVYYVSPSIDFAFHTLTLSNSNNKGINVRFVHYQQYPDDQTMLENLDGLINITCDKFQYSQNPRWEIFLTSAYADHGSYSFKKGAKAWYIFNGTRVHVFANREKDSARMIVRIDDEVVAFSNLNVSKGRAAIVYSSGELPFGEHKIEIENGGVEVETPGNKPFTFSAFLIDPLPKFGGFKLGYKDRIEETGFWVENTTGTPTFSSDSEDASITFSFHGTRFWVTGERGTEIGNAEIIIDEVETIQVRECVTSGPFKETTNGQKSILYYQSKVYKLEDHKVKIKRSGQRLSLVNILYSTQPYNGIIVPYNEMINDGQWQEEQNGYISQEKGSTLSVTEYFDQVWIVGNKELSKAHMNIYYGDTKNTVDTSTKKSENSSEVLLYEIKDIETNTYELRLENNGDNTDTTNELPLHISYLYYLSQKTNTIQQEHKTLNISQISHDDSWQEVTKDGIKTLSTSKHGAQISFKITCSKFWISGSFGPNKGSVNIIVDDEMLSSVSLYQEKEEHQIIYYQSSDSIEFGYHTITLSNPTSKEINVYEIHYYQSPDDQSIIQKLDGLINITCDKLEYYGDWHKCIDEWYADFGSYSLIKGTSVAYTFNGTKVYLYANREPEACNAIIKIDGIIAAYVDLYTPEKDTEIVFSSNNLPFGEHRIEVINDGGSHGEHLTIASLFVNPLPQQGGYRLGYNDKFDIKGNWVENIDNTTVFSSSDEDASITFKFHGTRFWITGVRGSSRITNIGKFDIKIDDQDPFTIDEIIKSGGRPGFSDGNKAVLLYQSDVLDLQDHTVVISRNGHKISLVSFFYSNQPYNGVRVPYNEMNKERAWKEDQNGYLSQEKGSSLSVTEYFNHVWIVGNNQLNQGQMDIYYNGEKNSTIDTSTKKTEHSSEVMLYQSEGLSLNKYDFKIENSGDNQKHIHISALYYRNDYNITINEEFETVGIADMNHDSSWSEETKSDNGKNLYSKKKGSKITAQFSGDKFWIAGSLGPNYGNVDIILDDVKMCTVSLYREREEDNVIYYESPSIDFSFHTLTLSNSNNKGINVRFVHYQQTPDDQTMLENLDGLINITCDKLQYSKNTGWFEFLKGEYADHGSYTKQKGAKAWYTFNGTQVHVFAIRELNSPRMIIRIDDKVVANANLNVSKNRAEIIFTSDRIPFGEHKIEIEHAGVEEGTQVEVGPLTLSAFLIDPLPKFGGFKLGYKDRIEETGFWVENTTRTPTFSSDSEDASITFSFHGTRFWVTGERGTEIGNAEIIIDEVETIQVRECVTSGHFKETTNGQKSILYYQSKVYKLEDHKVKIKRSGQRLSLVNILYSTQPYNGIIVPYNEMINDGQWQEEQNGYISQEKGSTLSVTEYFDQVWIVGNKELSKAHMNVYYGDTKNTVDTSTKKSENSSEVLLYEIKDIETNTYELKLENNGDNTDTTNELPLHISYLYYLSDETFEIDLNSIKIDSNEILNRTGTWNEESLSDTTNNLWSEEVDSCLILQFTGGKFWLLGTVGPNYGTFDIIIDDKKIASVSLYKEKVTKNYVYYESPSIAFTDHTLTLVSREKKKYVSLYSVFYDPVTPTFEFTASKPFTKSTEFSPSVGFSPSLSLDPFDYIPSCSVSDNNGNYTLNGKRCEYTPSNDNYGSSLVKIARSNFTDINYIDDGGAIHIINSGFVCETVMFTNCSSESGGGGAIYIKNSIELDQNVSLVNLIFTACHANYGGALFVYSNSDKNSVLIRSCKFTLNYVLLTESTESNLFGGSAIYISTVNSKVIKCKFSKNGQGSSTKVVNINDFISNSRLLLFRQSRRAKNELKNSITLITDCEFEIDEESKSSINIIGENEESKMDVNVVGCTFSGKLRENAHYIDGKLPNKFDNGVNIESCKFEDMRRVAVKFEMQGEQKMKKFENKVPYLLIIVGVVASCAAMSVFAVLWVIKSRFNEDNENDEQNN